MKSVYPISNYYYLKIMKRLLKITAVTNLLAFSLIVTANAQSLLPESIRKIFTDWQGTTATEKITGFVRLALTLAFGVVILAAVAYSIMAAIKYIRSQGDAGQVEEANKAIKAIFQGVAMMFVGIIGVVIVFFIFDVALPDPSLPAFCVKCPDTQICRVCSEGRIESGDDFYTYNDEPYNAIKETTCNTPPETCPDN